MEQVYALGVTCIEYIQYKFEDYADVLENVNYVANPHNAFELVFPIVAAFDSVFAAQYLLCAAFGDWLNAILKWLLAEHRPYWWVHTTTFYQEEARPQLRQYAQTCETGPGCPSGHMMSGAAQLMLILMFVSHIMNDRKRYFSWWRYLAWPLCAGSLAALAIARMFVATHFPHQCLLGLLCGFFVAPAICIYITDPFIWGYAREPNRDAKIRKRIFWHVVAAFSAIAISFGMYWGMKLLGKDPQWSVKLAFRWCVHPEDIKVTTTPLFALVESTATILGWAVFVTPTVATYRHNTKRRSLLIAVPLTVLCQFLCSRYQESIDKDSANYFYIMQFIVYAIKPLIFLRAIPMAAMLPYAVIDKKKKE